MIFDKFILDILSRLTIFKKKHLFKKSQILIKFRKKNIDVKWTKNLETRDKLVLNNSLIKAFVKKTS